MIPNAPIAAPGASVAHAMRRRSSRVAGSIPTSTTIVSSGTASTISRTTSAGSTDHRTVAAPHATNSNHAPTGSVGTRPRPVRARWITRATIARAPAADDSVLNGGGKGIRSAKTPPRGTRNA